MIRRIFDPDETVRHVSYREMKARYEREWMNCADDASRKKFEDAGYIPDPFER